MAKKSRRSTEEPEQELDQERAEHEEEGEAGRTPLSLTRDSKVELWSTDDGFGSAWHPATVVGHRNRIDDTVSVRYEHMLAGDSGDLAVERVSISNLRPPRPPEDPPGLVLVRNDVVDAFLHKAWRKGFVLKVVKEVYTVAFWDPLDVLELPRSDLRAHFDWVDNSKWVRAQKEQVTTGLPFTLGTRIEIDYEGKPGTNWMPAFYLGKSKEKESNFHMVKTRSERVSEVMEVDISRIRPRPAKTKKKDTFELSDKVDAFRGSLWSVGVITQVLAQKNYVVTFSHDAKEMKFDHSKLRPHVDWNNGNWVTLNTEVNQAVQSPPVGESSNKVTAISDDELDENVPLVKYKESKGRTSLFVLSGSQEAFGRIKKQKASSAEKRGPSQNSQLDHVLEESVSAVKPKEVMTEKPSVETNGNGVGSEQNRQHVLCESPNENFSDSQPQVSASNDREISLTKNVNESGNNEAIDSRSRPFVKCSPVWEFLQGREEFKRYPQNPHFRPLIERNEKHREGEAVGHMVNFANLIDKTSKLSKNNSREEILSCMGEFSFFEVLGFDVKEVRADLNKLLETKVELEKLDQLRVEIDRCTEEVAKTNNEIDILNGKRKLLESKMEEEKNKVAKLTKEAMDIEKNLGFCVGN